MEQNFWDNKLVAEKILKEKKIYEDLVQSYEDSLKQFNEIIDLYNLALEENNHSVLKDSEINILELHKNIKKDEVKCFLSKEADPLNTYLEIHAGAGGTESQDWAEMLRRMYIKWTSSKSYKFQLISEHKGDEAGIKSSTIKIWAVNF